MYRRGLYFLMVIITIMITACQTAPEPVLPTMAILETVQVEPTATSSPTPRPTQAVSLGNAVVETGEKGYLRVIHAAPDAGAVDIYVETARFGSNLGFRQISGKTPLAVGSYTVKITPRDDETTALAQTPITLQTDQSIVVLFGGTSAAYGLRTFTEPTEALRAGESRVTFINAVPEGAGVSAWNGEMELSAPLGFGQASEPMTITSDQITVSFRSGDQITAQQNANLFERTAYTFLLTGNAGNETIISFNERIIGRPTIRVIHAAQGVGEVNFQLDGEVFASTIAPGNASERQATDSGSRRVSVYAGNTSLLENVQLNANADENLSLILAGDASNLRLITQRETLARTAANGTRISFVNALPTATQAGVNLPDDIIEVAYGQGSTGVEVAAGAIDLYWQQIERNTPTTILETADNIMLEPGYSYLYILTGNSKTPVLLRDEVGINENTLIEVAGIEALPTGTPQPGTFMRFINALNERTPFDVQVNGLPVAQRLEYGQGSGHVSIPQGQYTLSIVASDTFTPIMVTTFTPPEPGYYTVLMYHQTNGARMLMITDTDLRFDPESPNVRLINLSISEQGILGLAFAAASEPEAEATAEAPLRLNDLPTIPAGVMRTFRDVEQEDHSVQRIAPIENGDLLVTYSQFDRVASRLTNETLAPGMHYDIVAFELFDQSEVRAFIVAYPQR